MSDQSGGGSGGLDLPTWFHGVMARQHAEALLNQHGGKMGLFLVRESPRDPGYVLSMCFRSMKIHYQIKYDRDAQGRYVCSTGHFSSPRSFPAIACLSRQYHN